MFEISTMLLLFCFFFFSDHNVTFVYLEKKIGLLHDSIIFLEAMVWNNLYIMLVVTFIYLSIYSDILSGS